MNTPTAGQWYGTRTGGAVRIESVDPDHIVGSNGCTYKKDGTHHAGMGTWLDDLMLDEGTIEPTAREVQDYLAIKEGAL